MAILASASLWPLAVFFTPLAGTIAETTPGVLAKEVAFLAVLIALAFDELKAEENDWLLSRLPPNAQIMASYTRRLFLGGGVACMSIVPAAILGTGIGIEAFLVVGLTAAHLAAVYSLAKAFRFKASPRSVLVSFIAVAVPTANLGEGKLALLMQAVLDPRTSQYAAGPIWPLICAQVASIFTLLLVSAIISQMRLHRGKSQ